MGGAEIFWNELHAALGSKFDETRSIMKPTLQIIIIIIMKDFLIKNKKMKDVLRKLTFINFIRECLWPKVKLQSVNYSM